MKKHKYILKPISKYFSIYDIVFLVFAVAVFIYAVFFTPVHSIADQGDFERIMRPCGLDFPIKDDYSFYGWAERFFSVDFTKVDLLLYIPRLLLIVPTTTFIFPTAITNLLCIPFGAFDVRILAVVMFLWYTTVCLLILRRIRIKNSILHCIFLALFIIVFYNGVNLAFFNSLYGQSVMLVSFATLVLSAIYLFENVSTAKKGHFIFFTIASCLLINSKLQCFVFMPFLIAAIIYAGVKSKKKALTIICSLFVLWHGVGGYIINGGQLNNATQYDSVFYGILKDSSDPVSDLKELGIDEALVADIGKHAFLPEAEYEFPPSGEFMQNEFYSKMNNSKIAKFYLSHPVRLLNAMEKTAQNAFYNKIDLGTFEKKYGFEEGYSSYRFDLWENVRSHFPTTLIFIIPIWLIFLIFAYALIKKKNNYGVPLLLMFIMGAIQFPMPYIGNGAADITKQLFLFNIVFDIGLMLFVYTILIKIDKKRHEIS